MTDRKELKNRNSKWIKVDRNNILRATGLRK